MIFNTRPHPFFSVLEQQKQLLCQTLFSARTSSGLKTDFAQMQHFGEAFAASFSAIVIGMVNYVYWRIGAFRPFIRPMILIPFTSYRISSQI